MAITGPDVERFRRETKGVQDRVHFNNAGSALPPDVVVNKMVHYIEQEALFGGYEYHRMRMAELEATYDAIAQMINSKRDEVALLENATAAWNAAFQSIPFEDGDEVITNSCDYASNYLAYLNHDKRLKIKVIPDLANGDPGLAVFETLLTARTKLVAITHMPTNSGLVYPVEEIGALIKNHELFYLVDACQSAGQYPLDVEKIQCDFLSATGRKYLRAPRGTGFLYARKSALARIKPKVIDLHGAEWTGIDSYKIRADARQYELWEGNRAAQLGLKVAVDYVNDIGTSKIWHRVQALAFMVREGLKEISFVECHDRGSELSGIISFTVKGLTGLEIQNVLFKQGINVSWNGSQNTLIDMKAKGLSDIARCSVHYYNTEWEIYDFLEALKKLG